MSLVNTFRFGYFPNSIYQVSFFRSYLYLNTFILLRRPYCDDFAVLFHVLSSNSPEYTP